jgi:hypothetical protein
MIISIPSDPGLRRMVLPSIIRISDAGLKTALSGTASRPRKRQLKLDFDKGVTNYDLRITNFTCL